MLGFTPVIDCYLGNVRSHSQSQQKATKGGKREEREREEGEGERERGKEEKRKGIITSDTRFEFVSPFRNLFEEN